MGIAVVNCTIQKAGYDDLVIPIGSFQVVKRKDGGIGVQVVTRPMELAGGIADRANGYVSLMATVNGITQTLGTAKISKIRMDEGPINRSITIQATR